MGCQKCRSCECRKDRETWLTPYFELYQSQYGKDSEPPAGQLAKYVKMAEKKLGRDETIFRFREYVWATTDGRFFSPAKWYQTLGQWTRRPLPL